MNKLFYPSIFMIVIVLACSLSNSTSTPLPSTTLTPTTLPSTSTVTSSSANPSNPKPGKWGGITDFGSFSFTVNPNGTGVTYVEYTFNNYGCNGVTHSGTIGNGQETGWDGEPIKNGQFTFSGNTMTLVGAFDPSGTSATGTWNYPECSFSGTWTATPTDISQDQSPKGALPTDTVSLKTETSQQTFDLLGVWKTDDVHAPDNSWAIPNSMYLRFTLTKQYVYNGDNAYHNNQSDEADIVYLDVQSSTFIKKITYAPDHPEYKGKFQKWTWSINNGTVSFTIYNLKDSLDLAMNDTSINGIASGVKIQESQTETPLPPGSPTLVPVLTNWNGIPIMAEAITGQEDMGDYQFTIKASSEEITNYYKKEMAKLGWKLRTDMMTKVPGTALSFSKGSKYVFFMIESQGENYIVYLHPVQM
jgi:hypothetical protein